MNKILIILFIISINSSVIEESNDCGAVENPKYPTDCSNYNNKYKKSICCLVKGLNVGKNGTACLSVNELFNNKTVSYDLKGVTGYMICGDQKINSNYLKLSYALIFILLSIL